MEVNFSIHLNTRRAFVMVSSVQCPGLNVRLLYNILSVVQSFRVNESPATILRKSVLDGYRPDRSPADNGLIYILVES